MKFLWHSRDQFLHLLLFNLSITLDNVVINQPLAHIAFGPSVPNMLLRGIVVIMHFLE